ncbi:MAG: peptidylprolyl isomerase [Acidobacteriia bacterium]|nr:peptidylprolyl isomerase [Terriglobia bacterium]
MRSFRLMPLVATLVASSAFAAKPVLQVNDTQLTDVDLKLAERVVTMQMQSQAQGAQPNQEIVTRHALDQLIGRTVLLQAAHEAKITADPVQVAATLDQQRTRRGAEAFQKYLTDAGLTEQEFTSRIEEQMVIRKFAETVLAGKINVTETDAKTFYDSNAAKFEHPEELKIRTILLKAEPNADEKQAAAAKERAEVTRRRVTLGEDMAKVASEVSDDPSKARGGDVGWVRKGMLLPELEPAVWALKPGQLSEVLKSKYGYHIFKVEDHRVPGRISFDEVKARLTETIKNEKLGAAIEVLVRERSKKANIKALDPTLNAALESFQAQLKAETGKPATKGVAAPTTNPTPDASKKP